MPENYDASGVTLNAAIKAKVKKIADAYNKKTGEKIKATSGTRSASSQASAMYGNLAGGDKLTVYKDQASAKEIKKARLLQVASNEILQMAFDQLGADVPSSLVSEIAETYRVEREEAASPFPGAIDTLIQIRKSGARLALITNGGSEGQRYKIDRFGIAPLVDYILIEGEFGVGKPDEKVYLHALDQLGAKPAEAWMVGDNLEWEIAAPQKLGIRGIWVDWAGNGLPESTTVRPYTSRRFRLRGRKARCLK